MKRHRLPSSSEDSDDNGSLSTWSQHSRSQRRRTSCSRDEDRKPSEVFRTDLITAMKLHDSFQLNPDEYYVLADPWRQEWEKGVQVPVSPGTIPEPVARVVSETKAVTFTRPRKFIVSSGAEPPELGYVDIRTLADSMCRYDLNDVDVAWLQLANEEFKEMGMLELDEYTMERVMEEFEQRCYDNMNHAIETEEGLGIEYDEDVVCDVCQSPDGEDGNEMVFCDKCNICVHQACYGILKVPEGSWLCRTCALGVRPKCLLCPKKGGAMKPTRSGTKWVHVSCALWIPEVSIGSPEKMEPITKVSHIPSSRWALVCSLCNEKVGASIQCSVKNCRTAFHVTCAFDRGLEMKTILAENDEVKFKSYCPKHSSTKKADAETLSESPAQENRNGIQDTSLPSHMDPFHSMDQNQEEAHRVSLRKQKLQQLEDEFYTFVESLEVAKVLRLPEEPVEFLYQYWKLKRKSNFNKPLITPKKDEEDNLAKREQDVLFRRLQLFTHLRQDLERVRNLTYMVTRREKIKRSVCKVQEQIFNSYTKQLEQERVSGVPSSFSSMENTVLFNSPSLGPNAPKIEDLKWHSAFFRKQMGTSLAHSLKKPPKRDRVRDRSGNDSKSLLRQPSPREGGAAPGSFLNLDKPFAETRLVSAQQKNGVVLPEHRKRRDNRPQCEGAKAELKEKTAKHNHKALRPTELSQRQLENKRAVNHSGGRSAAPGTRRDIVPKCNGGLVKVNSNQTVVKVPTAPTSPGKNWGGFRIPKKGERQQQGESLEEACRQNSGYPYLGVGRVAAKERTKSKLKADSENDGYVPDAEMSDSEPEVAEKKCRQQRLSPSSSISRRTDIIRRSILAT
ncbi:protein Jade-1 isoform X2 [Motacilla alba alba]|nr:protein Jade-1 isoform X2 [Motacilla alba alba]XP_037990308.1 protein Jade-1 isoform X2 [Motacilla alba alba]XP_037990309.1 protein Jade-1 isoform X2 [Motacilla alba alba]XP_037990310.1 protein Jade-1 isoform X2 [Motacilla alba alba]XP_037990311.1 protein Jade-1 isoform X2 [Motacilla alba alba]XP_037990312.1 protein Jade-1 isoform X2 [Motacilla alba alba]XP_037990313.1 protein Jade-1 isoform X2 [Motacilla alba alba]XP_037990315.1 protein Jade-1 isoform X2 [Motacilla alba alba]XP_03799031